MKKVLTWFVAALTFMTIFNCTDDRIINNGDSMLVVRTKINQNFSDLYDSVQHHTDLIQVIDYIGTQDSIDDHRTAINSLVVADGAMDTRVDALELIDHTHSNSSILNATTASFTTSLKTQYDTYNDTLVSHNDRILYNKSLAVGLAEWSVEAADSIVEFGDTIRYILANMGSGTGTGDVKVSGNTVANTVAYWEADDSTLVSDDVVKLYADSAVFTEYIMAHDSIYYLPFAGVEAGSIWWTNSVTGAIDSANTESAYIGWEMEDLPTLEEYEKDVKMINGHMERRVWYIDYETKELKSQYGWDGLGMMNTQSAYMIYHEITVRWMFEQNKKLAELEQAKESDINLGLDVKFLIGLLVFVALMGLIVGFRR
jgi:hypothetical protein